MNIFAEDLWVIFNHNETLVFTTKNQTKEFFVHKISAVMDPLNFSQSSSGTSRDWSIIAES